MQKTFENFKRNHREDILKETMKKLTFFPLLTYMDKIMINKEGVELVTSLSLSCKTFLEKFLFWSDPLRLEIVERKGKKWQNIQYPQNKMSFLEEIKTIFNNF